MCRGDGALEVVGRLGEPQPLAGEGPMPCIFGAASRVIPQLHSSTTLANIQRRISLSLDAFINYLAMSERLGSYHAPLSAQLVSLSIAPAG
jgi:hypothetical protein